MRAETSALPEHVGIALENWEFLAFTAYDWFEKRGRVVIGIDRDENDANGAKLLGVTYDYQHGEPDPTTAALLAKYDPEMEIIIQFTDLRGGLRTQRLRTAPDARHPKRVWFFEMLRRAEEEPESLDVAELPEWFKAAILKRIEMGDRHDR